MKRKSSKYLEFYKECMKTGILPRRNGLCWEPVIRSSYDYELFDLVKPTIEDEYKLEKKELSVAYWASGLCDGLEETESSFTPLRQTIVLFMHEIYLQEQENL